MPSGLTARAYGHHPAAKPNCQGRFCAVNSPVLLSYAFFFMTVINTALLIYHSMLSDSCKPLEVHFNL